MFLASNYDVARSIQEDRLRKAEKAREGLKSEQLNDVAVGVGVRSDPTPPRLRARGAQARGAGFQQPVMELVDLSDGKVDHQPQRVPGVAMHLVVDPDREAC
jgi:hypothetical protein